MYFAIVSRFAFPVGMIVRNEKTEPISLSMNPPTKIRQEKNKRGDNN